MHAIDDRKTFLTFFLMIAMPIAHSEPFFCEIWGGGGAMIEYKYPFDDNDNGGLLAY